MTTHYDKMRDIDPDEAKARCYFCNVLVSRYERYYSGHLSEGQRAWAHTLCVHIPSSKKEPDLFTIDGQHNKRLSPMAVPGT